MTCKYKHVYIAIKCVHVHQLSENEIFYILYLHNKHCLIYCGNMAYQPTYIMISFDEIV